jgi:succinate dehydrogenase/fumarate reductase cytochrome b subunit
MEFYISGLFGVVIFIADIWAILNVIQSRENTAAKLLWIILILALPLFGLLIWWLFGPRQR